MLIDVDDVALGHETKQRWNNTDDWIYSSQPVHTAIIDADTFAQARRLTDSRRHGTESKTRLRTQHRYVLRGLLYCGLCHRRMQGQKSRQHLYYRCRYTQEYALANTVDHPTNVYLPEQGILAPLDDWLAQCLDPAQLENTLGILAEAQDQPTESAHTQQAQRTIDECDQKLTTYRQALEAGTDPTLVAGWTAEVQARRAEALGRLRQQQQHTRSRLSHDEIRSLVQALGNIRTVLHHADNDDKAQVYAQLGLHMTYHPEHDTVRAELKFDPHRLGLWSVSEAGPDHYAHALTQHKRLVLGGR